MKERGQKVGRKKRILWGIGIVVIAAAIGIGGTAFYLHHKSEDNLSATESSNGEVKKSDNEKNVMNEEQKEIFKKVKASYDPEAQTFIAESIAQEKSEGTYTADNMLIKYNPFGRNTQSMYVYFSTEDPKFVSYTIHVDNEEIDDFTQDVHSKALETEHEFQLIGLIPNTSNTITFTVTGEDGSVNTYETSYEMGDIYGEEELVLDKEVLQEDETLEDGLFVILGNDSSSMDFMYFYDNQGVLRGEVPILGYRSHRLLFRDDYMYYSISEKKIAQVNRLGQVTNVYQLGDYKLHHDYVFDEAGNLLILATDTRQDSIEDIVLKLNPTTGDVSEVLDLGDLMEDYKESCTENSSDELDWTHLNTIQYIGDNSILISSRETSSILKIKNLSENPEIAYIISDEEVWGDTSYEDLVLEKTGDFTIQGGQHTVTYETDDSLEEGQYYLYMFNNNIGYSETRPDFDWTDLNLTNTSGVDGDCSYYYKYLVDENKGTFELVDSFEVPYSGYVSSVQDLNGHTIVDSGLKGTFTEYDSGHKPIVTFTMDTEKFIYRVFKYEFD